MQHHNKCYQAPNDIAYSGAVTMVWQILCKLCRPLPLPAMGSRHPFFRKAVMRTAEWLALLLKNEGDAEINPGSTTTRKQVWICDICHRQINVMKQISTKCNRIEHCLFTTHMLISSQFRKPNSPLKQKHPKYITSPQCVTIACTRQEVGSSHSLETT